MEDFEKHTILLTANQNGMIYDQTVLGMDLFNCSSQRSSRIDYMLKVAFRKVANLHGHKCSIIFVEDVEEQMFWTISLL